MILVNTIPTPPSQSELSSLAHYWKARLFVGGVMLMMALLGLVIIDLGIQRSWFYWHVMIVGYALLSLWLSWYLRHKKAYFGTASFQIEILHWIGLMLSVYLVSILVDAGILSRVSAGFVVLILLALTMFLAGLYVDQSFILISATLAIFIAIAALMQAYMQIIMIPVIILAVVILGWWVHKGKHFESNF